jgi:hypothetical protein
MNDNLDNFIDMLIGVGAIIAIMLILKYHA